MIYQKIQENKCLMATSFIIYLSIKSVFGEKLSKGNE